jgi:hypothetical protein
MCGNTHFLVFVHFFFRAFAKEAFTWMTRGDSHELHEIVLVHLPALPRSLLQGSMFLQKLWNDFVKRIDVGA